MGAQDVHMAEHISPFPSSIRVEHEGNVFELPQETIEALTQIAVRNRRSYNVAIESAIRNEIIFETLAEEGRLIRLGKDGKMHKLEFV